MKKFIILVVLLSASMFSACASTSKELTTLELGSLKQQVRNNEIKLSFACNEAVKSAIATAKYKALSTGVSRQAVARGGWMVPVFYEEPACVAEARRALDYVKASKPIVLPENLGRTVKQASDGGLAGECGNRVDRAVVSVAVSRILNGEGKPDDYYMQGIDECERRAVHKSLRRAYFLSRLNLPYFGFEFRPQYGGNSHYRSSYYGAPGNSRRSLWRRMGYTGYGQNRHNYNHNYNYRR